MFKKNPDLIDHYLNMFLCATFTCVWIFVLILCLFVFSYYDLSAYLIIGYVDFVIIDYLVFVLVFIIGYLSIGLMYYSICLFNRAYSSFMES